MSGSVLSDAGGVIGEHFSGGEEKSRAREEIFFGGAPCWFGIGEICLVVSHESFAHAPFWFDVEAIFFVISALNSDAGEIFFVDSALSSDTGEIFLVNSLMSCVHGEHFSGGAPFGFDGDVGFLIIRTNNLVGEARRLFRRPRKRKEKTGTRFSPPLPRPRGRGLG